MFHDLLLALYGREGGFFSEGDNEIKVNKQILNLHPAETVILDILCSLGTKYKYFETFCQKYDGCHVVQDGKVCGMYMKAFGSGVSRAVDSYRRDLIKLEEEILANSSFSLVYMRYQLDQYFLLFPNLEQMVREVEDRKAYGCQILSVISRHLPSGIPIVSDSLNKVLQTCHTPFFMQLNSWMMHGLLNDPFKEFFIVKAEPKQLTDLQKHTEKDTYTSIHSLCQYDLDPQLLPSYVTIDLALKILFVGSAVCLFDKPCQVICDKMVLQDSKGSLFGEKEERFTASLSQLREGPFTCTQLSSVVNEIYNSCNELVWQVVVEEAGLLIHLQRLKNFFLLGKGEIFSAFIDEMFKVTDVTSDLNRIFLNIVSNTSGCAETEAENFYMSFRKNTKEKNPGDNLTLECSNINLSYRVQWPLNAVLSPSILERYNNVFRFLLLVRQVQQELQQSWKYLMRCQSRTRSRQATTLWQLWTHMMYLINNLQYHVQIEVLENEFRALEKTVKTQRNFEEVLLAHNTFLSSVMKATFLTNKQMHHCLVEIMNCCRRFCLWVSALARDDPQQPALLSTIVVSFRRYTLFLFKNLQVAHPNLYMRIDYNKYLTNNRVDYFGGTYSV